mgnify:CR=1 FL=1
MVTYHIENGCPKLFVFAICLGDWTRGGSAFVFGFLRFGELDPVANV